jgi:hypothetical protein
MLCGPAEILTDKLKGFDGLCILDEGMERPESGGMIFSYRIFHFRYNLYTDMIYGDKKIVDCEYMSRDSNVF